MSTIEGLVRANTEAFTQLYGERGVDYMLNTAKGGRRMRFRLDPQKVDARYFTGEMDTYNLQRHVVSGSPMFYRNQVVTASAVMQSIQRGVFPSNKMLGVLTEIATPHTRPHVRLEDVAGIRTDSKRVAEDLRWQSLIDVVLIHGSSLIDSQNLNVGLVDVIGDLHAWLGKRLFSGNIGETHPFPYRSFHNPKTNTVMGIGKAGEVAAKSLISREHTTRVRHVKKGDFVYIDPRIKGISAVEKLVDDALENGGEFKPENVRDKAGILLVSIGDRPMRDSLVDRVADLLEKHPQRVGELVPDDKTGENRGQRPLEWRRLRFPMLVTDVEGREGVEEIEFIFKALIDHRNQIDETGVLDPITGELSGEGHEAFQRRRKLRLLRVFTPPRIYKEFELEEAIREGGEQLLEEMMNRGLVKAKTVRNEGVFKRALSLPAAILG